VVLRLFVTNGSNDGPALSPTAANWSESAITWNNRPARSGPAAADLRATPAGTWVEYDLTGLVTANGTHSFNLRGTGNDGAGFNSREAPAGKRPELIITTG
jgi:hypothetical protein